MASEHQIRIESGFDGGQIMGALVDADSADRLERALAALEDGALTLDADDGSYTVALGKVVYVKRFARESRLGFGNA